LKDGSFESVAVPRVTAPDLFLRFVQDTAQELPTRREAYTSESGVCIANRLRPYETRQRLTELEALVRDQYQHPEWLILIDKHIAE
jgi:hypothetical protein